MDLLVLQRNWQIVFAVIFATAFIGMFAIPSPRHGKAIEFNSIAANSRKLLDMA